MLDFDETMPWSIRLLHEHDDVREKYQDQFEDLLVDEYQDTNLPQYVLIRQLANDRNNVIRRRRPRPGHVRVAGRDHRGHQAVRGGLRGRAPDRPRHDLPVDEERRRSSGWRTCSSSRTSRGSRARSHSHAGPWTARANADADAYESPDRGHHHAGSADRRSGRVRQCVAASGHERFIIQPFHADRGDDQFVASTRSGPIELMAAQLGCDGSFLPAHGQHYEAVHAVLRARWPDLGEGATASGRRSEAPRQRGAAGNTRTR